MILELKEVGSSVGYVETAGEDGRELEPPLAHC